MKTASNGRQLSFISLYFTCHYFVLVIINLIFGLSIFTTLIYCLEYSNKSILSIARHKSGYQILEVKYNFSQPVTVVGALKRGRFLDSAYVELETFHL